jgi:hypothetical protein
MGRKDSHRPAGLRLRLLGRRLLATWLCLLRHWAGHQLANLRGAGSPAGAAPAAFWSRNRERQEELRQFFIPYHHLCPECGSFCCREGAVPFSAVDRLLYGEMPPGAAPREGKPRSEAGPGFWQCFRTAYLYRQLQNYSREQSDPGGVQRSVGDQEAAVSFCPALGNLGCRLPWGERPAVCVLCACPALLEAMSWAGYGRYLWVNARYLGHLTRSLGTWGDGGPRRTMAAGPLRI